MELTDDLKQLFIKTAEALTGSARRAFGGRGTPDREGWATARGGGIGLESRDDSQGAARVTQWSRMTGQLFCPGAETSGGASTELVGRDPGHRGSAESDRPDLCDHPVIHPFDRSRNSAAIDRSKGLSGGRVAQRRNDAGQGESTRLPVAQRPEKSSPEEVARNRRHFRATRPVPSGSAGRSEHLTLVDGCESTVLIGPFSRRGQTRVVVRAMDHDFRSDQILTPWGIFLPEQNELYLYFTASGVTADFIVDCLRDFWETVHDRFPQVTTLLLHQDNGPENHSRRTQFMKRMTELVDTFRITVQLAYYPPYHSKYNPIERVWGVLERHWNGSLLDTIDMVLKFAQTMTWKGRHPVVELVKRTYQKGVKLTRKEMDTLEKRFERLPGLDRWFVKIAPVPLALSG